MRATTLTAKLSQARVCYTATNIDGCVLISVPPKLEWDRPIDFFCMDGRVRCEYMGNKSVKDGIALAVLGGIKA